MCTEHTKLFKKAKTLIEDFCQNSNGRIRLFNSSIPRATNVGEANFFSTSIIDFAQSSNAAKAYVHLAQEVLSYE